MSSPVEEYFCLTTHYEIMYTVLNNLSMKELNKAARVCKSWKEVADIIKKKRAFIYWIFGHKESAFYDPKGLPYILPRNGGKLNENQGTRNVQSYVFERLKQCSQSRNCWEFVEERLKNLPIEPAVALIFATKKPVFVERWISNTVNKNCDFKSFNCTNVFPSNCRVISCVAPGVIGTPSDLAYTLEMDTKEHDCSMSLMLFPELPGVTFNTFTVPQVLYKEFQKSRRQGVKIWPDSFLEKIIGTQHEDMKCLLLMFCADYLDRDSYPEILARTVYNKYGGKIAIGGGLVNNWNLADVSGKKTVGVKSCVTGLIISGKDVAAASVIIKQDVVKIEDIEKAIKKLKESNLPEENSVAFMFACVARGLDLHLEKNVESRIFRKQFPQTPLVGFFGNGEIGTDYIPQTHENGDAASGSSLSEADVFTKDFLYGYSTVFVFISFGNKNNTR